MDHPEHPKGARIVNRRQMLKGLGILGSALAIAGPLSLTRSFGRAGDNEPEKARDIPRRPLGKTGIDVSILAVGGSHLGRLSSRNEAIRIVHEAIDSGITFFDNAWEYNDGRSEEWMGKALEDRRQKVVLMTKVCTHGRDKKVAMEQLEQSLRRLRTDYLDLWQIHEVVYEDDPDHHFAPGGAAEALLDAKRQGKVRFIGFTGHKHPDLHLKMLSHDFPFDTCQLPLNVFDGTYRSFEHEVLPELERRGIAAIGMKTLSGNGEPIMQKIVTVEEALRYALTLPTASIVSGIDSVEVLRQNVGLARRFIPLTAQEMNALRTRMASYAADGRFEPFKSSRRYDGPIGRQQHGIS
ncbi:MAG TPA: aldo/keto reductase [Nitrospiraceae bacterium]|nr:aldo/keto reductase [Nitrospiraceae bacterium]